MPLPASAGPASLSAGAVNMGIPRPFSTSYTRVPSPDEKSAMKPLLKQKALPAFQIDNEIASINAAVEAGDLKGAITMIYSASRNLALIHGFNVPDSMTHREFLSMVTGKELQLIEPLMCIITLYEKSSYAGREANRAALKDAVNGLKNFYMGLEKTGAGKV